MPPNEMIRSVGRPLSPGAIALMLMLCFSWGFNQVAVKLALPDIPAMLQAFNVAHYRYMDLIQFFAAKRVELATKIDRGEMTEQQAKAETQKIFASIQATERQRDATR